MATPPLAAPAVSVVPSVSTVPVLSALPSGSATVSGGPPPITVVDAADSDEDADVHSLTIPFRSASSSNFLSMISIEDKWITELEFRY